MKSQRLHQSSWWAPSNEIWCKRKLSDHFRLLLDWKRKLKNIEKAQTFLPTVFSSEFTLAPVNLLMHLIEKQNKAITINLWHFFHAIVTHSMTLYYRFHLTGTFGNEYFSLDFSLWTLLTFFSCFNPNRRNEIRKKICGEILGAVTRVLSAKMIFGWPYSPTTITSWIQIWLTAAVKLVVN